MNSLPQLYNKFAESERELYSIRYLCLNEPECALISFSSLDSKTIQKIIENLIRSRPPYKELFNSRQLISTPRFQWLCFCVSKSFDVKIHYNLLPLLLQILHDDKLFLSISKILEIINKVYNNQLPDINNSKIDSSLSTKVLSNLTTKEFDAIISLSVSYPQLFRALSPYFDVIFNAIDINKFYPQYGYTLLPLMDIESLNLKLVIFNDYPQLESIIQKTILDHFYYNNFHHSYQFLNNNNNNTEIISSGTFLYRLQNDFFITNSFPAKTFFGDSALFYSFLNTSLSKCEHFVDVSGKRFFELFHNHDLKNALDSFSLIPQMESWAVVAVYDKKEYQSNLAFLPEILPLLPQDLKPTISTEFLIRSNNDNQFKIRIIQMTGQQSVDFVNHSIPFICNQWHNETNPFNDFESIYNTPLLSYSDEERINDCDFIAYYFAIVNEIKCITDELNIDDHLLNLNQMLRLFSSNYDKHNSILIDLFSLLFLQVDNKFICSADAANKILPLLSSYIISDSFLHIFTKNLKKVNISNILFAEDHKLNHALLPFSYLFDLTLTSHDWELAKQLEGADKRLRIKREVFNETYNFSQTNKVQIEEENSVQSLIVLSEIGLSYENQTEYLNLAKKNIQNTDSINNFDILVVSNELKSVLSNRKVHPLLNQTSSQEFFDLSNKLQKITSTEWKKTEISDDYKDCRIFCSFFSYLDAFIPVILDSNYADTVVDALSIQADKLIFDLYSENRMNDVNQVANALKMDVFESVILYSNKTKDLKIPFIKEFPIINFSDNMFSDENDADLDRTLNRDFDELSPLYTFNSNLFSKLKKYKNKPFYDYLRKSQKTNQNEPVYEGDLFYINNVPVEHYEKVLTDLIQKGTKNDLDIDEIAELSFSVSSEFFENLIQKNITKLDLNILKKLSDISNCSQNLAESIDTLIEVSKDFQPVFPLENSFRHLLSTGSFKLASDFCRIYRYQMKASKVLREVSLSLLKQSKSIKYVLNVCPQLKNEIIDSIPARFKEKAIQDGDIFFDIIPQKWKRYKDQKTTFVMNMNDDENAYLVFQKLPNLNVDHELLTLIQTPSDIRGSDLPFFIKMLTISLEKLLKYFRNPYELCQKVLKFLISIVTKIEVDENENESSISVLLHRIHTSMIEATKIINNFFLSCQSSIIKNPQNQKRNQQFSRFFGSIPLYTKYIGVLGQFVLCLLGTKFGLTYSFKDFQMKEKATELMKVCLKYDIPKIATQFMDIWGLAEQSTLIDDYALILFRLGRFDDGLQMCIDRRMKKSVRTMSIVDQFVDTCSYSQLFDQNNIEKLIKIDESQLKKYDEMNTNEEEERIPNNELFDFISNNLQVNGKTLLNNSVWNYIQHSIDCLNDNDNSSSSEQFVFMPMKTSEQSLRAANRYLKLKAPLFMRVKKLVIIGNFDKALKLAMNNNNKKIDSNNNNGITFNLNNTTPRTSSDKSSTSNNSNKIATQRKIYIGRSKSNNAAYVNNKKHPVYSETTTDDFSANDFNNNKDNKDDELSNLYDNNSIFTKQDINESDNNNQNNNKNEINNNNESNKNETNNNNESNNNDDTNNKDGIINTNKNENEIPIDNNNNNVKNRSTKIVFGTENVTPGSPKKTHIATINGKQRIMQERFNLFLENIFVVSISYSNFSKMKVKLLEFDPTLHFFGSLVEKLLQYSMNNDMPHLKFELELFLGRTDSAALTSIALFKETKLITDLENALKAVKKDLQSRKQNTKIAPNSLSVEIMKVYEQIIPLQIKFMKFIQQISKNSNTDDIEYNRSLSLFNGKKAAISTVIVLFRKFNFSLALEIIINCDLNVLKIADDLCDMIYNERNSSMLKLIRSLEDSFPDEIFMKIINRILMRLFYLIDESGDLALRIIENGLNNEDFKTRLFIQFGYYEKALENAKKWKLFYLMPLIAHEATTKDPGNQSSQIASLVSSMLARVQRSTSQEF